MGLIEKTHQTFSTSLEILSSDVKDMDGIDYFRIFLPAAKAWILQFAYAKNFHYMQNILSASYTRTTLTYVYSLI